MPAITVGLAEVEARLHALQRRLNSVTLIHVASVGLALLCCLLTGLILLGLRGSIPLFRVATWTAVGLSLATAVSSAVVLRRRWLDLHATAHLADRNGLLNDRLLTLIDLRERPRPSRLAPILVAQILALGAQWQPQRIAPRRIPRSVLLLLASLLLLGSTAFLRRPPPAPAPSTRAKKAATGQVRLAQLPGSHPVDARRGTSGEGPPGASLELSETVFPSNPQTETSATVTLPGDVQPADQSFGSLPDRLQQAIRKAFRANTMGQPRQLASNAERRRGDAGERGDTTRGEADRRHHGPGKPESQTHPSQQGTGGTEKKPGQSQSMHAPEHNRGDADKNAEGTSPAAGAGSSPSGLMNAQAPLPSTSQEGPRTFKLTITSFLRAVEQKGNQPRHSSKHAGRVRGVGVGGGTPAALSERQLNDDVLRKAEIPPEYEDIVRRVYSMRANQ